MAAGELPNYIRTYRKRAFLTQSEVAFLLGAKSSAGVSRHERFKQIPDLETLLAYEVLFRAPVRNLFKGTHAQVEGKLRKRVRLLIQKLTDAYPEHRNKRKIQVLTQYLNATEIAAQT